MAQPSTRQAPPPIVIPSDPLARKRRKLELKRRLSVIRDAARLEGSFKAFVFDAWRVIEPSRKLAWNWHLDILCETIEAIARGEIRRCVVNVPPRTMKSTLFNVMFPAWTWTIAPERQFLNISTDSDLAMRDSTVSRVIIQSEWYQERWGKKFRFSADQNQKAWYKNNKNGHRQALGMTSKITGKGADCLPAGTMIATEAGDMDIAGLVRLQNPPRVLGYNHAAGRAEWRRIVASREVVTDGLVEITTHRGRKVCVTGDHRVYVAARGYRAAQSIGVGDGLVATGPAMRDVRRPGHWGLDAVLRMLPVGAEGHCRAAVRSLLVRIRQAAVRVRKDGQARGDGSILLESVSQRAPIGPVCRRASEMRGVRKAHPQGQWAVLLGCVRRIGSAAISAGQGVCSMWQGLSFEARTEHALLSGLRGCGPFGEDGGKREPALQGWPVLRQVVRLDAPADPGAGWLCLRRLWPGREDHSDQERSEVEYRDPPRGRRYEEQHGDKPGRALPAMPHGAPQIEDDAVSMVRSIRCDRVPVYDIQVEGTHNFFANQILVHNCIVIDDPHNVAGAQSEAERNADIAKFDNEIQNRLNDQATGAIVIIMQRLHEQDLTGHVLPRGNWLHLCFPMEYDAALATEGVDERTSPGDLLWPERFPRHALDELKTSMTPYAYSGQYQQRPTPAEGGILKRAWWNAWPAGKPLPPCDFIVQTWDGAYDAKTTNDYTAGTTWGVFRNEQTHRHNIILLERFRERIEFPELRIKVKELYTKHGADLVLIEPKATGKPLVQELRRAGVPVQEWQPERGAKGREVDKTARTHAAAVVAWGGAVWHPVKANGEQFAWVSEVIEECAAFPNAAHDDLVDTVTMAWLYLRRSWWAELSDEEPDEDEAEDDVEKEEGIRAYG